MNNAIGHKRNGTTGKEYYQIKRVNKSGSVTLEDGRKEFPMDAEFGVNDTVGLYFGQDYKIHLREWGEMSQAYITVGRDMVKKDNIFGDYSIIKDIVELPEHADIETWGLDFLIFGHRYTECLADVNWVVLRGEGLVTLKVKTTRLRYLMEIVYNKMGLAKLGTIFK